MVLVVEGDWPERGGRSRAFTLVLLDPCGHVFGSFDPADVEVDKQGVIDGTTFADLSSHYGFGDGESQFVGGDESGAENADFFYSLLLDADFSIDLTVDAECTYGV